MGARSLSLPHLNSIMPTTPTIDVRVTFNGSGGAFRAHVMQNLNSATITMERPHSVFRPTPRD